MRELCHRCHGELPLRETAGSAADDEGALLFCPRCGAPQLLLPEHMRVEDPAAASTTGALPPPRPANFIPASPGPVDWRAAIAATSVVAGVSAALMVVGLKSSAASFLSSLWTLGGAVIALGLYARSRPLARIDAMVGLRVGVATGVLMVAAMGIALAATGMVMRFGTHSLGGFDADVAQAFATMHSQMVQKLQDQGQAPDVQQKILGFMGSPEARAGVAVFYLGLAGCFVTLLSAGGGAFAGMLRAAQTARPGLRRGE